MIADTTKMGIDLAEKMIEFNGMGHSAVIHATDEEVIDEYSLRMKASRIIVNSPSSHGAIGDLYNTNMPSLTLGCGSYGGNRRNTPPANTEIRAFTAIKRKNHIIEIMQ